MAPLELISDAVLWAVTSRAHETQRIDRVLEDRFASDLVTDRGEELFGTEAHGVAAFVTAVVTATIDSMLRYVISNRHLHTVADLGAGLDTRPYRLELPSDLRWIEADLAPVLDYKAIRLAHAMPHCQVRHVSVDLSDVGARHTCLHEIARDVTRGLVLTETFVWMQGQESLDDLIERMPPVFPYWIIDTIARPRTVTLTSPGGTGETHRAEPPISPPHALDSFERHHWRPIAFRPLMDQALRLDQARAARLLEEHVPSEHEGVWLFQRVL